MVHHAQFPKFIWNQVVYPTSEYGNGYGWNSNTAGLLMECSDYTEIAGHDDATRVASIAQYSGPFKI